MVALIDLRDLKNTQIYNEFDEVENTYWFDYKKNKFLHNIDTFYYSVKFQNDFTANSTDKRVKHFRHYMEYYSDQFDKSNDFGAGIQFFVDGLPSALNFKPFGYAGWYNICLECPEYFDIFFAPKVPHASMVINRLPVSV